MAELISFSDYGALVDELGTGVPDSEQYTRMSGLVLDVPEARALASLNPLVPEYKTAAMALYLHLRGRPDQGYVASRDEAPSYAVPTDLSRGVVPWSFQDVKAVSEHVIAWGNILSHLNLPKGGTLLEYGPGSGQILLMAARMGYRACGVDIDAVALECIQGQAAQLNVPVETERAEFGRGFDDERFDTILFYEAFHHAFHFDDLLMALHDRLKPGGRVVLCGEPVVPGICGSVPYPWGPRLDALSVFCMRRFGWMELGFTHDFLMRIADLTGWTATYHPSVVTGRAHIYVLEVGPHLSWTRGQDPTSVAHKDEARRLRAELASMYSSTSWRMTRPIRSCKTTLRWARGSRQS